MPSIMVCGAFHFGEKSELVIVEGPMNHQVYLQVLRQYFLPWPRGTFRNYFVLVQDNAPLHKARATITSHKSLHWRHNDHDGVSNHQPHRCLPNRLFRSRSNKTSKLRVTGLRVGNSPGPVNSPHKGPVTRKMFPFDDVIMSGCGGYGLASQKPWYESYWAYLRPNGYPYSWYG